MTHMNFNYILNLDFIIPLINNIYNIEIMLGMLGALIIFSGRAGNILDTTQKIVTSIAAATIAYKNLTESSSSYNDNDKDKNKEKNDKEKNKFNYDKNYSHSFSLAFILNLLDINIPENASTLTNFSFSVFLFSLISLLCFLNVVGFLTSYILIQKGEFENKYPRFKKIIIYYKKSSILYVIIEAIICFACLSLLIFFSLMYVYLGII